MKFLEEIVKGIKGLFKPFEGFQKEVAKEGSYFLLGIAMDVGKGMGWKGNLFVWPFAAAFAIGAFLIARVAALFVWRLVI